MTNWTTSHIIPFSITKSSKYIFIHGMGNTSKFEIEPENWWMFNRNRHVSTRWGNSTANFWSWFSLNDTNPLYVLVVFHRDPHNGLLMIYCNPYITEQYTTYNTLNNQFFHFQLTKTFLMSFLKGILSDVVFITLHFLNDFPFWEGLFSQAMLVFGMVSQIITCFS